MIVIRVFRLTALFWAASLCIAHGIEFDHARQPAAPLSAAADAVGDMPEDES